MPYTKPEDREQYDAYESCPVPETDGDLTYVLSRIVARFVHHHGKSYSVLSDARDALTGCSREFERCVIAPYEQQKREANGDVWGAQSDHASRIMHDIAVALDDPE